MGQDDEKFNSIKSEVKSINRSSKVDSIIEGKEYKEMDIKDHPEYFKVDILPKLMYLDFVYESGNPELNEGTNESENLLP